MIALIVLGVLFALGYLALGNGVSHVPPFAVDAVIRDALRGHALALAVPLTQLGRFPAYVVVCATSLAFGIVRRAWFLRTVIAVVALAGAWKISDFCKDYFMRARPPGQLVFHESTFSYASGHATLSLTFYGMWAIYAWRSDLAPPIRLTLVVAAALLILAIAWSRLALGAHYFTDVIGGYLLGATFLCIFTAAMRSSERESQSSLGGSR